jgi:hypothetical protein
MAITISPDHDSGYYLTRLTGHVTEAELLASSREHYESQEWSPLLQELVDLSELEAVDVTSDGLRRLSDYVGRLLAERGIAALHTAIYAPRDLPFGLARVYEAMADESPEHVMVFRSLEAAKAWLKERR